MLLLTTLIIIIIILHVVWSIKRTYII